MAEADARDEPVTPRRLARQWLAAACFALVLVLALLASGWTTRLDNVLYDAAVRLTPRTPADDVLIVAIDDRALAEAGAWPWPRSLHAELVRRLGAAGARAIAYDVLFLERAPDAAEDATLAAAITGRTCLPLLVEEPGPNGRAARILPPPPAIARNAAGLGHVDLTFDPDGVSRRANLALRSGAIEVPHLMSCLAAAGAADPGVTAPRAPLTLDRPLQRGEAVLIPFSGAPGQFRTVSAVSVLRGELPEVFVRGRYVLVGATAAGLHDSHSTPLSTQSATLSGVELQASLLEGLLHGRLIHAAPPWLAALANLLPVCAHLLALRGATPRMNLAVALIATMSLLLFSVSALVLVRIWIPPFPALLTLLLVFPVWGWLRLQAATNYLVEELTRFAPGKDGDLRAQTDIVGGRIAMLRRAVQRARDLKLQQEQAVQLLSHDIRSPFSSILALLDGPHGRSADPELTERIRRHVRRTLALADNFVHLAKAESGQFACESLDLSDLLDVTFDDLWPIADQAGVELKRAGAKEEAWVYGDRSLLCRALANLIDNAIKFSPSGGSVEGRVEVEAGFAVLSIRDQGPGLARKDQADVFDRFRRGRGEKTPGVGLGLALVSEVARGHGGRVACDSEPGQGATFSIALPLHPGAETKV